MVIHRGSEPVVRLVPVNRAAPVRRVGALAGKVFITDAFFDALPDDELAA